LSRTAFFSEFLIGVRPYLTRSRGQQVNTNDRRRPIFAIDVVASGLAPLESAEPACRNAGFDNVVHTDSKGLSWWIGQRPNSGYDHNFAPDTPACAMFFEDFRFDGYFIPASSDHSSVIQVSFGDGHVASIRKSIDSKVWRAIGSISGGEPISENDY
jgi:prepilin-type processing-associated H-X9-DG protein